MALDSDLDFAAGRCGTQKSAGCDTPGRNGFNRKSFNTGITASFLLPASALRTSLGLPRLQRLLLRSVPLDQLLRLLLVLLFHLR